MPPPPTTTFLRAPRRSRTGLASLLRCGLASALLCWLVPGVAAGKTSLDLGAHGQVRHVAGPAVDDPATGEDESALPARNELLLRRLRLGASLRQGDLRAKVLFGLDRGKPRLLTGSLRWRLDKRLDLELGQHKRLLGQGYLDSSRHQRLPERAELYDDFGGNRDIGLSARFRPMRRFELRLAVWNGAGANVVGNDTGRPWVEGRATLWLGRRFSTEDATIGRRPGLMLGVAAVQGHASAVRSGKSGLLTRADSHVGASSFVALRAFRVLAQVEVLYSQDDPIDARADQSTTLDVASVSSLGVVAQLAFQPVPTWELAARYAFQDPNRDDPDQLGNTIEFGVGWRPDRDDDRKLQLAVQREHDGRPNGQSYDRWRVMTQLQWSLSK